MLRRIRRRGVGTGGGAIDFVKLMQTVDFQQATEFLRRYDNIAQCEVVTKPGAAVTTAATPSHAFPVAAAEICKGTHR